MGIVVKAIILINQSISTLHKVNTQPSTVGDTTVFNLGFSVTIWIPPAVAICPHWDFLK